MQRWPVPGSFIMRYAVVLCLLICFGSAHAEPAANDAWPTRPITVIVPYPAGSATDIIGRIVTHSLSARLGQPIVVENRPGADATVGTRAVAKSAPDGYTLAFGTPSAYVSAPTLYENLAYDPVKDFAPVTLAGRTPYVFAVYPGLGVKSVTEFVALAKSKPGELNYSSVGEGSISHVGMLIFADKMGIKLTHIPYKSTAQSIIDVSAGIIHVQLASIPPALPLYQAGKVQILAVAGPKRVSLLPDVPTMTEAGIPDYEATFWLAMFAPAGTPPAIVARLNREMAEVLKTDEIKSAFAAQGVDPESSSPEELGAMLRRDIDSFRSVIAKSGIKSE
jgi:tripartite-type tricarboxylate transporter receptor subunit TctC